MLDPGATEDSHCKKAHRYDCLETNAVNVGETGFSELQTTEQGACFLKKIHSLDGSCPDVFNKKSSSNRNNNVRDDSDSDDFRCFSEQNCRNRRLHFLTFLAGSNELHCVFQPNECQPSCCDPLPIRSSCYTGRCSPSPCLSPTERISKCQLSPATPYPCSKSSSVEDSITEWLRCKERNRCKEISRCKDTGDKYFGNRKPCKKIDLFPASSSSDVCCKKPPKCECIEKAPRPPPPPPYCEPVCFSSPTKPCYCPKRISCSPPPPCSPSLFRDAFDDCFELGPCEPVKCDLCCVPPSKTTLNVPTTCHSSLSCLDTSDKAPMRTYRQFRKDYVRKWGIKISNSDGGEWVYKDCDNILPIYRRKNGKITRITLANDNDACCEPVSSCPKKCEDIPQCTPCCTLTKRQRRGSLCRKLDMCNDSVEDVCKPKITCFIERACTQKKLPACPKVPRTCSTALDFLSTPRHAAQAAACCSPGVFSKPSPCTSPGGFSKPSPCTSPGGFSKPSPCTSPGGFSKPAPCSSPPSCLKKVLAQKPSCLKPMKKVVSPFQSPVMSCPCGSEKPKCLSPKPSSCTSFGGPCG